METIRDVDVSSRSINSVIHSLMSSGPSRSDAAWIETGFLPLDQILGGGIRAGDLYLVGGNPGVGKTILVMQWARSIALRGIPVMLACYEHDEPTLLARMMGLELGELAVEGMNGDIEEVDSVRRMIRQLSTGLSEEATGRGSGSGLLRRLLERMEVYGDNLHMTRASGSRTGTADLERLVLEQDAPPVLIVDYLQKMAVHPEPPEEADKVTKIVEALKDMALEHHLPVVAVVAADKEALRTRRLRLHHLRGSSALAYEADVAMLLNDKRSAVSKVHLAYDAVKAETFKDWVVLSIEKNRGGPTLVDLEYKKDFGHFRFSPMGGYVSENLIDERMYTE